MSRCPACIIPNQRGLLSSVPLKRYSLDVSEPPRRSLNPDYSDLACPECETGVLDPTLMAWMKESPHTTKKTVLTQFKCDTCGQKFGALLAIGYPISGYESQA